MDEIRFGETAQENAEWLHLTDGRGVVHSSGWNGREGQRTGTAGRDGSRLVHIVKGRGGIGGEEATPLTPEHVDDIAPDPRGVDGARLHP